MSYQEKRIIVLVVTGLLILGSYLVYVYNKYQAGIFLTNDMKSWSIAILVFIGIGVVATIIIQIFFHIMLSIAIAIKKKIRNESCSDKEIERIIEAEMVTDEMDKLIELKSMRISFGVAGLGFIIGLGSQLLNYSPVILLNILFISFILGSILEGLTQLYYYRKGVRNG